MKIGIAQHRGWIVFTLIMVLAASALFSLSVGSMERQVGTQPGGTPAASPAASPVAGITVEIAKLAYQPETIEIPAGTTVTWVNNDSAPHTVTHQPDSGAALFDSGIFVPGESWSYTFDTPGTYDYYCIPHPFMVGKVIVT